MTKIKVGIFFGGKSAEHEVSIQSARNVLEALDKTKYEPILIGIDREGGWHTVGSAALLQGQTPRLIADAAMVSALQLREDTGIDVALPILHGPMGEDGTMQGFFELAGIPYVGPGVLASATSMDKDVMKRLLRDAGIPIAPFVVLSRTESYEPTDIFEELGNVVFVKPANMGSSVGVSRAETEQDLRNAIKLAFEYDTKILIEAAITGSEIECAVLGNEEPEASAIGRIMPRSGDFYSYDAKYIDEDGAVLEIPADISQELSRKAQEIALTTYRVLGCEGMSRVDMFLTGKGEIIVNEINTIPGFTKISMYPKLWEATGLSYGDLISRLIELAVERHQKRQSFKTSL